MSAETAGFPFMLLFRGTDWDKGLSAEEIQQTMSRWTTWFDRLTNEGKARLGQPLTNDGKIVSGKNGSAVVDGPFSESKEAVAGYILLRVADLDAATEIAKECPGLDFGMSVEIRPISEELGRGPD
ncbi:MAG: hypothetical protein JOZ08_15500 [Verrucomicrobia bacterium]|nr:hypothetical protein [Verrucomicrobiota bacterium]MBV8278087.1 hypothetical protein [Verrucomicrobiota bacterium]